MQKVTYTNSRGDSAELYRAPFFLNKIEGLGDVDADIQSQKAPGQDGSTYIDATLSERYVSMEVAILKDYQLNRQLLSRVFNPKLGEGMLVYENNVSRREIRASSEHVPIFPDNRPSIQKMALVDLFCPNPFWLDTFYEGKEMAYIMGGLKFGLSLPTSFSSRGFKRKANNEGDVETPVLIEFKGPAVNPTVTNETTGEYIKIKRDLGEQDVLTLSTEFGQKYVRINGENAFHYIDLASTFWQLKPGENILSYSSNNDSINTRVAVRWKNRYLGV